MDYEDFKKENKKFEEWDKFYGVKLDDNFAFMSNPLKGGDLMDVIDDRVNSPSHYKGGRVEAIDTIEDAIKDAPSVEAGMLQAQVLKYLLRIWLKDNPEEDAKKAQWYLNRLITKLNSAR